MKKTELLSPAGNFEKLKSAIDFGADAVYCAGQLFGMRASADNFTVEELKKAVEYVHARGKKLYLTVNTMPHVQEYPLLRRFLSDIKGIGIDAFIVADLGVLSTVRELLPEMEIHISTQTSVVSPASALAYAKLGAKRIVLARELQLSEIREIVSALPPDIEVEAFIHGSMCISYSGRCLLANAFNGRDGNRGTCSQPCRWNYSIVEEKRTNDLYPIEQQENVGTFIMSSKDMCMIEHIPELMESGITSFKIEGRMKSAYYTGVVTNAYRLAIDAYCKDPTHYTFDRNLLTELDSVSHREYGTGFYFDNPMENAQTVSACGYLREKSYYAIATEDRPFPNSLTEKTNQNGTMCHFEQRNKMSVYQDAELLTPGEIGKRFRVTELYDETGAPISVTAHAGMGFYCRVPFALQEGAILRASDGIGFDKRDKDIPKCACHD